MERLKNITIIFLLAVGLPASAAPAKSASVLLQEGLYAEEIEGDLDAAIKIYEQVIAQAKETQRAAAQATYRIGMCYLKKGEKGKAAGQFRDLIVKFPEHESLVAKAQEHLAKLKPPVTITGSFGPVRERIVNDDGVGKNFMLDLDTGSLFSVSDAQDKSVSLEDFILEQGIDVIGETKSSVRGLMGVDMVVIPIANERWDISPEDVVEGVSLGSPGRPVVMSGKGELPATFMFKTKKGGMGVLQILQVEVGKAPRHIRIRYKMLQEPGTVRPTFDFGPEVERIIHSEETGKPFFFDLDTGQAFYPPPGLTRSSPEREVIEWTATKGIDFVNSRGHLELVEMTTVKVERDMWESATPAEIKDALLKGTTQNFLPTRSKDYTISSPITYVFKTREGGIGILQILEKKDNNLRIRYKMLQERAKTVAVGWRKVFLPDADTPGVNAILDLASGELLPAGEGVQQLTVFREMGKGDLAYDRALICIRGGKAKLLQAGKLTNLKIKGQIEDSTAYELPGTPCHLVVTTAEGDDYEVTVMSADNSGANLEYKKMLAEPAEVASVASFGPAKVARLYDIDHPTTTEKECAIDFDTGKLSKIPPQARQMPGDDLMKWLSGSGVDAVAEIAGKDRGLIGVDVAVKMLASDEWDTITPQQLRALLAPTHAPRQDTKAMLFEDAPPQPIFSFRTRDSRLGILQILDVDKSKQMVQFRYKMLEERAKIEPVEAFGPVIERIIYTDETGKDCFFDLDTGKAFSIPQGLTRSSDPEKGIPWILENGIDFVNCVGRLQLWDMVAVEVEEKIWDSEDAVEINSVLMRDPSKEFLPTEQEEYIITAPFIYAFETREGGIGILQILEKRNTYLKIRYKMLREPVAVAPLAPPAPSYPKGLVGHWKFDEGSGMRAYDSEGNNHGTIHGARWTAGKVNGALYFDSRDDYVSISPVTLLTNWTVSAWCQPLRNEVGGCNPIMGGSGDYYNYIILCEAKHHINLETDTEGDWVIVGRGVVDFNEWAHYTVTRNGNTVSAYKNGVYIDDATLPKGDENTITKIGSGYGCQTYYKGRIDDVRIYNRALSKQEVRALYRSIVGSAGDERVTGFGPAEVARLYDIDHPTTTEKECAIDFDTGKLSKIPPQARQMPGDDLMKWLSGRGIDAVAEIAGKNGGLIGIDVTVKTMSPYVWDKISPTELRALVVNNYSARQETTPMLLEDQYQKVFVFRTRDSGLGILQLLEVDKSKQMVQFRYKMLQGETAQLLVSSHKVFLPEGDTTVYDLLDLASSRIINSEPGGKVIDVRDPAGKGNLCFDKAEGQLWLVGVRGTRMRLRSGGELLSSEPDFISYGIFAYYLLGEIPCQYLVTTAQGDKYEVKVLSMDAGDRPGVHIEYWKSAESPGAFDVATPVRGDAAKQEIAAKHSRRLADTIAEMGWDLRTFEKAERGGDLRTFERFDKAEEVFKKALEMDPTNASALKGLAVTCMERKEYGEAIKYYEMWLKAEPNNKDAKAGLEKAKAAKQQ